MNPLQTQIIAEICDARLKQKKGRLSAQENDPIFWAVGLGELFGNVCECAISGSKYGFSSLIADDYESSLIQLAAFTMAALEYFRINKQGEIEE